MLRSKLSRREFLVGTGLVATTLILEACAPKPAATPEPAEAPAEEEATAVPAAPEPTEAPAEEEPTAVPAAPEPVTVRYGRWANPAEIAAGEKLIEGFEGSQDAVKVEAAFLPWPDYWPKMQAELAAGTAPDIIQMSVWYIVDFMENNALLDLDAMIEGAGVTDEKYFTNTAEQWRVGGKLGCLPSGLYAGALFYNTKLFDEEGVEYPSEDTTWDELLTKGLKLTVDSSGKHADEDGFDPADAVRWGFLSFPGFGNGVTEMWMMQNGGGVVTSDLECLLTMPESIEAVQFMFDLVNEYHISPTPEEVEGLGNPFLAQLVAMHQDNHSRVTEANMTEGLEYDIVQMPIPKAGQRLWGNYSANGNAIYAGSENPDGAWQFLEYMISDEVQEDMATLKEMIPFNKAVATSDAYLSPPPNNMMAFVKDAAMPSPSPVTAPTKHMGEWNAAAAQAFEAAWLGKVTIEEAAQNACDEIAKILSS